MDIVAVQQAAAQAAKKYVPSYAHPTLAKLARNAENVVIAALSDSTGQTQTSDGTKRWPRLVCDAVAAMFPAYTVKYHEWSSDGTQDTYNGTIYPDVTIQTGTGTGNAGGPFVLDFYNGSISGTLTYSFLGNGNSGLNRYPGIIGNLDCDLIFSSFGHNHAVTDPGMSYRSLIEQVTLDNPRAHVVLIAQSPNLIDLRNAVHATHVASYAQERGFGFVDVHKVFTDAGTPGAWYVDPVVDRTHPSLAGSTAWANAVTTYLKGQQFPQQQPSTLSTGVEGLLVNGELTDIGNTLKGWTMVGGAVASKDFTQYDRPGVGFSIKLTAPVANASQSMLQSLTIPPSWRGKWVTVAARLRKATVSSVNSGIITINDGAGTGAGTGGAFGTQTFGAFYWAYATMKISATGTALNVNVYSEYTSTNSATTGFINVDRVVLCVGRVLRDLPIRRQRDGVLTDITIRGQLKLRHSETSNDSAGLATLVAGTVTVSTTALSTNDRIILVGQSAGAGSATWGELTVSAQTAGTNFTITSSNASDTRTVYWFFVGQSG